VPRSLRLSVDILTLNSQEITALAQAEADAAVAHPQPGRRRWRDSTLRTAAVALLAACWTTAGAMWWGGMWQASQALTAVIGSAALALLMAAVVRGVRAAREALEVVDAHD